MLLLLFFKVWLGNNRGTTHYSRNHTYLNPDKDKEFWEYSFQEMAEYDLPAIFKYIKRNVKDGLKINYIGHSEGTM